MSIFGCFVLSCPLHDLGAISSETNGLVQLHMYCTNNQFTRLKLSFASGIRTETHWPQTDSQTADRQTDRQTDKVTERPGDRRMKKSDIPSDYRQLPASVPTMRQVELNPTHPSIPSRWEKKQPRNMDDYYDGFGSRAQKLKHSVSDVPGPGFYQRDLSQHDSGLLRTSVSLSKKGFGNAFLSKSDRLGDVVQNKNTAGPGHYTPKSVDEIYTDKSGAIFAQSGKGRVPFDDPLKDGPRAGPGQYRVTAQFVPAYIRNKPSAAMRSLTKREAVHSSTPS